MTVTGRSAATLGMLGFLAGCQLISGLSGLQQTGGTGGATSATSSTTSTTSTTVTSSTTSTTSTTSTSGGGGTGGTGGSSVSSSSTGTGGGCTTAKMCGGGSCQQDTGTCTAYKLFTNEHGAPQFIAANGTYVYTGVGTDVDVHLADDGTSINHQGLQFPIIDLAASANALYALSDMEIDRIAPDGSASGSVYTFGTVQAHSLHANNTTLWWDEGADFMYSSTSTWSPTPLGLSTTTGIFDVAAGKIYWWDGGAIERAPNMPIASAVPIFSNGKVTSLSADRVGGGYVYFITNLPSAQILRVAKAGGTPASQALFAMLNAPFGRVAAGVNDVVWTDAVTANGSCTSGMNVVRQVVGGSMAAIQTLNPTTILNCPVLAQDDNAFYWNDGADVWRVVKTP